MVLQAGVKAPEFNLPDETGRYRQLAEFSGKPLILYFYPKDDTPGCTTEACNFRDEYSDYVQAGVTILGVSPDSAKSHEKFINKYKLPFSLLADEEHRIADQYGVWGLKEFMGKSYEGVLRTTFLLDSNGMIQKVFENVKPAEHSTEILTALKEIS